MLSRFITAACSAITTERNITSSSSAESTTTIAMKSGSLPASTFEKSIEPAVKPPTRIGVAAWRSSGGSTSLRSRLTRFVVADAWGAESG